MLLMILCGITGFCSPQYFTSVSKANIILESQISVTAFKNTSMGLYIHLKFLIVSTSDYIIIKLGGADIYYQVIPL